MIPMATKPNRVIGANICFDCEKACGGCSWSAADPVTGKLLWEPVPGWTAEAVTLKIGGNQGGARYQETYRITACPEFTPSPKRPYKALRNEEGDTCRFCEHCGKPLISRSPLAKYCTTQCHDAARRARRKVIQADISTRKATPFDQAIIRTDAVTGQEVRYPAMVAAAASVDGSRSGVSRACATGRAYRGHYWRKENDDAD